jgi:short subunit dehydrogenase-like uncharacterized protein
VARTTRPGASYPSVSADRELDVVLFGATSFVGRLTAEYLSRAAPPQARVVASTVGPYRRHGLPLLEACARAGTHYADSIPSDLGVLLLHEAATADGAGQLEDTTLVVRALKGIASGGTAGALQAGAVAAGVGALVERTARRRADVRGRASCVERSAQQP